MSFSLAFSPSLAGHFWMAALILISLKLISTIVQITLMRGDYRNSPNSLFFRTVYFTGKITPFLAVACTCLTAILLHNRAGIWFYGVFAVFIGLLALYVVRLRRQGRFFGALDWVSRKRQ
jgi:xanthine/uracil permease